MIDLTNVEMFRELTVISYLDGTIDLHNDFNCAGTEYNLKDKKLTFFFDPIKNDGLSTERLSLVFIGATITRFELFFARSADRATLNSFYRGRFEENGAIFEYSSQGEGYYYIEFEEGDKFELFSKEVILTHIEK